MSAHRRGWDDESAHLFAEVAALVENDNRRRSERSRALLREARVASLIINAKAGSVDASRAVCDAAADYIEVGEPLPELLRAYMIEALRKVAQGDDARRSFRVARGRGQSKDPMKDPMAMKEFERIIHNRVLALIHLDGLRLGKACDQVCEEIAQLKGDFDSPMFGAEFDDSYILKIFNRRKVELPGFDGPIFLG
ncbi:hypothetical protein [Thiocapsa sp. UBA6158]|jgi:hypothetical protein|uniref:hypothetical protein n=1 Tax=Thiocapsa sp. UBA6158 TaxID=1947692 RepID=UPI0025CCDF08|nr:hypothetical protein [Thiocapsa sp. UBA6158]